MMPKVVAGSWTQNATATGLSKLHAALTIPDTIVECLVFKGSQTVYVIVASATGRQLVSVSPAVRGGNVTDRAIGGADRERVQSQRNVLRVQPDSLSRAVAALQTQLTRDDIVFELTATGVFKVDGRVVEQETMSAPAPSGEPGTLVRELPAAR